MIKNANELAAQSAKGAGLNPEDAEMFTKELYANKDAQRELGLLPNIFGDRETKQKLAALKMDQKNLFADIDSAVESVRLGTEAVGAGLFDENIAGLKNSEMVNAIIKSNLKDKVTKEKNIARLSRDEKTGELMYTLYDVSTNPEGNVLTDANGAPQTMTIRQFNEAIATNVDDKGAKAAIFNTKNNEIANRGLKSRTGAYDEQMKAMDSNWLDTELEKPVDLKRAMHMKFGYMKTSFFDDIQNPSTLSADLYNTLLTATGSGDVLTGGITDNMVDTDGEAGISQAELQNTDNYNILSDHILGLTDPEVSKAYFKDYVLKEFEGANNYGHSKKPPTTSTSSGTRPPSALTDDAPGYDFTKTVTRSNPLKLNGVNTNIGSLNTIRTSIISGKGFVAGGHTWNPNGKGGWNKHSADGRTILESYENTNALVLEGLGTSHEGFQNLTQYKGSSSSDDGGGGEIVQKDLSSFFGPKANEENAVEKLSIMYPDLEIYSPRGNPREKIYVDGEAFLLRGGIFGDPTPEMEMRRLQKKLQGNIDYYNQIDKG